MFEKKTIEIYQCLSCNALCGRSCSFWIFFDIFLHAYRFLSLFSLSFPITPFPRPTTVRLLSFPFLPSLLIPNTTSYCTARNYTILHHTVLHYTILYYTVLHHTVLYYTELQPTLHCITLHYTILDYTSPHYTRSHYTALHYTTLHHITPHHHLIIPHHIALYYTTLYYTTLHYNTLHYTTPPLTIPFRTVPYNPYSPQAVSTSRKSCPPFFPCLSASPRQTTFWTNMRWTNVWLKYCSGTRCVKERYLFVHNFKRWLRYVFFCASCHIFSFFSYFICLHYLDIIKSMPYEM